MKEFLEKEGLKVVVFAVLLTVFITRYLVGIEEVLNPFILLILIAAVAVAIRQKWARHLALLFAALGVLWIFDKVAGLLFPFIVSFVVAYLLSPLVDWAERRGVNRTISTLVLMLAFFLAFGGFIAYITPKVIAGVSDTVAYVQQLPANVDNITEAIQSVVDRYEALRVSPYLAPVAEGVADRARGLFTSLFEGAIDAIFGVGSLLGQLLNIILIPVVTFYLLKDMPRIRAWVFERIPHKYKEGAKEAVGQVDLIMAGYIRAQTVVCIAEGGVTFVFLYLLGVKQALFLGILTGVSNIIPFVGPFIGGVPAVILAALSPPHALAKAIAVAVFYLVIQTVDGNIIKPKYIGSKVGLHPVTTMIVMLLGAKFFGLWGFLLAVPVTGVLKIFYRRLEKRYLESEIFTEGDGAFAEDAVGGREESDKEKT
jgi:predicted PurR-regulated permease PerM